MTEKKLFQPTTFSKWLIPYIILILVPICFGVLLYQQALLTVEKNVDQLQHQTLEQRMGFLNDDFDSLSLYGYSLANSPEALSLAGMSGSSYTLEQINDSHSLQNKLVAMMYTYDSLSDVSIYFPRTGYLLRDTRFCPLDWSQEHLLREYGMTRDEIVLSAKLRTTGFHVTQRYGMDNLIYFYSFGGNQKTDPEVLILFQLDHSYIKELLTVQDSSIYMEISQTETYLKQDWMLDSGIEKEYYIMSLVNENYDFQLFNWLPMKEYQKTVSNMKKLLLSYLLGCLTVGVGGVWFLTRRNYRPVQELRKMTSKMFQGQYIRDDVEAVKLAYQNLMNAYEKEKSVVKDTRSDVKQGRMNQLLKRKSGVGSNPPDDWKAVCSEPFFLLMSIEILDFASFTEKDGTLTSEMMDVAYFALENVLEELEKEEGLSFINAQTDGICFSLINLSREQQGYMDQQMHMIAIKLKNFLNYQFHMPVSINISSVQPGWDSLCLCYQDIQQLIEYRSYTKMPEEEVAIYTMCRMNETESYGLLCRKLTHALDNHDLALAEKLFHELAEEQTASHPEQPKTEKQDVGQLIDRIVQYIEEHYTDNSLTVGFLADEFEIGLSWLSRSFKKYKEIGILEYINFLRLEKAKEMICAGYPIREVAIKVGFTDTQPLNRMFRQMIGMSPTEYRNTAERNHSDSK